MKSGLDNKSTPKEKILDATLRIIGTKGVQHVTSRKIAAMADVNVATINYYFGSKDNVINEALKTFADKLLTSFDYLDDLGIPPEVRIRNFLRSYADYTLEYPDIFRNFVDQVLHDSAATIEYFEFMKQIGLNKLKVSVQEITRTQASETELIMKIFQMFSCLEFPVLVGAKMKSLAHFDYYDQDCRYRYIDLVLKSLLNT
ncbi:HTH-type transcriptional regulator BetI [Sporomusa carbonis]|uniref:TetR/AcrR family transcriptional regulator n=1 Tax=Sporomusa carbonis TaxID=3076075 RepID=UPI003A5F6831